MRITCAICATVIPVLASITVRASSIPIGDVEFNSLFAGVNDFTVDNFTGSNNLGYFPVADNLIFANSVVTATETDGAVLTFDLGNIGPGSNTSAEVADNLSFTQATFSATLEPSTFTLTNGLSGTFTADPSLSFTLLPSSGSTLVAGVDLGVMDASPTAPTAAPEPNTDLMLFVQLASLAAFGLGFRVLKPLGVRTNAPPA
jgi:hypothetical protein